MQRKRRRLSSGILALGIWAGVGLGAGCTPNDAPGEPTGGPDRAQQEQLREMDRSRESGY
jgi:hypothetical protein